jgi:tetratricopeptide (TPR) repeat protein
VQPLSASEADALLRERAAAAGVVLERSQVLDNLCERLDRNLRTAAEFGLDTGGTQLVRQITAAPRMYREVHGLFTEARSWLDRPLALDDAQDRIRQRLLPALGTIAYCQGDHLVAVAASDEAASLAMQLGGETERFEALQARATAALRKGDLETAAELYRDALDVALAADNGVGTSSCRLHLAGLANRTGRHDQAEDLLAVNPPFVRAKGQPPAAPRNGR